MTKIKLTVRCVLGHEREVLDSNDVIRLRGYVRCLKKGCKRNAFTVKVTTQDDGSTEDDMKHLEAPAICPNCGHSLTGGKYDQST